jgi:proteasome alpha subunit
MQFVPNQVMGYDRAITVFSPDGRILQVEYAKKAIDAGSLIVGVTTKEGVILAADTHRVDPLLVADSVSKIEEVNSNIIMTSAGYIGDARVLLKRARLKAQEHKLTYGENINPEELVKYISDICQSFTQYGGIRPFGVSLLVGGMNENGPQLFSTEPAGIYFKYNAKAVGNNSVEANKILEKSWKKDMSVEDGIKLIHDVYAKILGKEYKKSRVQILISNSKGIKVAPKNKD